MTEAKRVVATAAAVELIEMLKAKHGPLMFHQSGGCCDGSSPMCYPAGEFRVGNQDVLLGELAGCPFYIGAAQYAYWKHTQLIIDVVWTRGHVFPGRSRGETLSHPLPTVCRGGMGYPLWQGLSCVQKVLGARYKVADRKVADREA